MREQYRTFRAQFLRRGVALVTVAVGRHYQPWVEEFPEIRLVEGDLLFQQSRLWMVGARIAQADGFSRFVCLDADVVFADEDWIARIQRAFRRSSLIQPFETALHMYDDARLERASVVSSAETGRGRHGATGLGVGFDSRFLDSVGLYEYAIVGGGDKILWKVVRHVFPIPRAGDRRRQVVSLLCGAGYPDNPALHESVWRWAEQGHRLHGTLRPDYTKGVHLVVMPHGLKGNRQYRERYELLQGFDPDRDLRAPIGQGLLFASGVEQLKADVAAYLRSRALVDSVPGP